MRNIWKESTKLFTAIALCGGWASSASAVICQGVVTNIFFEADGIVEISYGFGTNMLCNVSKTEQKTTSGYGVITMTPQYCQALLSNFMTAKASGRPIQMYFSGAVCPTGQALPEFPYAIGFL